MRYSGREVPVGRVVVTLALLLAPGVASAMSCRAIADLSRAGTPVPQLVHAVATGPALTAADVECLRQEGVPEAIVAAARSRVPAAAPSPDEVRSLDVTFVGFELAPLRGGLPWDKAVSASEARAVGVVGAVAGAGVGAAIGAGVARAATGEGALPDPWGTVRCPTAAGPDPALTTGPLWLVRPDTSLGGTNTLAPAVPTPPQYLGWPVAPDTVFRVEIHDRDAGGADEDLPAARLTWDDLQAALGAGGVYRIPVGDRTGGQLAFVDVRVAPAAGDRPRALGDRAE